MGIALSVVLLHIGALWALQSGLLLRAVQIILPAEILSEFIEPPAPKIVPPPPRSPAPPVPALQPVVKTKVPTLLPTPQPVAMPDTTPSPNAPVGVATPHPPAPPIAAPVAQTPEPAPEPAPAPAPPAPPKVELPSSDADYLQNPKPAYPPISKRLGEQGKVLVRVLIGVEGNAQKAEIKQTSGFERLDQSAMATVLRWRYTPGRRAGVPEAMWFNVPVNFVLE